MTTPRLLALAAVLTASGIMALRQSALAGAQDVNFIAPTANHVEGTLALPERDSATLPTDVMRWLRSQGLPYLIPRVPSGYPSVKLGTAIQVAAAHTPVGPRPRVLGVALISPLSSLGPIRAHQVYWAVVLRADRGTADQYYVSFVEPEAARTVDALRHP